MIDVSPRIRAAAILELRKRQGFAQPEYVSEWRSIARPEQLAPDGLWRVVLWLAGRGFGKTRTIVEWGIEQAHDNPGSRGAIVGATAADVRDVLIEGESGLLACSTPDFMPTYEPSKRRVTWPNGTTALLLSADEPNRFRGPQYHWVICDELAAWRYPETFDQLMLGLRLGNNPRCAVATTPRPTKIIRELVDSPTTAVIRGSTYDNRANLAPAFFSEIIKKYEGTRLGRQELEAVILDDAPGALWKRKTLDDNRVSTVPEFSRIVVAIDPAVTSGEDSDQTGIVVAALGMNKQGYVLEAKGLRCLPHEWASEAVALYHKYGADRLVAEINNGGDMIEGILRAVDDNVAYTKLHASRGKVTRAEPVAALYEQGRVHHVGSMPDLEDQMCNWEQGMASPDLLDAAVWALTDLMLGDNGEVSFGDLPADIANWRG